MAAPIVENLGTDNKTLTSIRLKASFTYDGSGTHCPFILAFQVAPVGSLDYTLIFANSGQVEYTSCSLAATQAEFSAIFTYPENKAAQYSFRPVVRPQDFTQPGFYREGGFTTFTSEYQAVCDLNLQTNVSGSIQKASAAGAADGSITIQTTSAEPHQFGLALPFQSVTNYQDAPTFSGLAPGNYVMWVRQKQNVECFASGNITLDFLLPVEPEEPEEPPTPPVVVPGEIFFSLHPIEFKPAGLAGSEMELNLYVESQHYQGNFTKVITRRRPVLNGIATFPVESILHTILHSKQQEPDLQNPKAALVKQGILNFKAGWSQIDPVTGLAGVEEISPIYTVIKGGLPLEERYRGNFFTGYLTQKKSFLTWHPLEITIGQDQPEFLYFLNLGGVNKFSVSRRLLIKGLAPLDTTEAVEIPAEVAKNSLICIPVLPVNLAANVSALELFLVNPEGAAITQTRRYSIDRNLVRNQKYFLYENSFGVWETLRTTGPSEILIDGKDEISESGRGLQSVVSLDADRKVKQSTGLHTPQEQERLQPFLYSLKRYEIRKPALIPIILQKRSYSYEADVRQPTGYFFEYSYAYPSFTYSRF